MTEPRSGKRMSAGFIAIIAFKYFKGALCILLGIAALHFVQVPVIPTAAELARKFGVAPENHIIHRVAAVLSNATPDKAQKVGLLALFVGAVLVTESTLMVFRVWWSTYLMIGLTALGLPVEVYEIFRRPENVRRYVVLLINVAIVVYLWRRRDEFRRSPRPSGRSRRSPAISKRRAAARRRA